MNPTADQIIEVANEHIRRYTRRVRLAIDGSKHYNLEQCQHYLEIWLNIAEKGGHDLSEEEQAEVDDAYDCGEYAHIWGDPDDSE